MLKKDFERISYRCQHYCCGQAYEVRNVQQRRAKAVIVIYRGYEHQVEEFAENISIDFKYTVETKGYRWHEITINYRSPECK
jgi:hypothetical protein